MTATSGSVEPPVALSRRRRLAFIAAAFAVVMLVCLAALLIFDIYLHQRVEGIAGLNVWGYRGPAVGAKKPGEVRVVALGGSTVFGYGLPWTESWPHFVERELNARRPKDVPVTVVNLGAPRDSVETFVVTMNDYAYLKYDVVVLYEGYNDLALPDAVNSASPGDSTLGHYVAWRHQSPVFRWTGYLPIFPLVLSEKAMALMNGGDPNAAYSSKEIVFRPGLATRMTAGAMKATADIALGLEHRFGRLTPGGPGEDIAGAADVASCGRWSQYCGAIDAAVRLARRRGQRAIVVTQPYLSDLHVEQQQALAANLQREFGGDSQVRYVNLGKLIDLHDTAMAYDGLHLTAGGNEKVAAALAPVVLETIQ